MFLQTFYDKGIVPVNAISISFAAVFTLITFKTFIFASAIEGRLEIFFLCCNYPLSKKALILQGKFMK